MSSQIEALQNSYLFGGNAPYVEDLYESYLNNPSAVPENWRNYFDQLQHLPATDGQEQTRDLPHAPVVESFAQRARQGSSFIGAQSNVGSRSGLNLLVVRQSFPMRSNAMSCSN